MFEICDISKKKKKKKKEKRKIKKLFIDNEELNQILFEKGLFTSIKGHLCLTKWHLGHPEGQVEVGSP